MPRISFSTPEENYMVSFQFLFLPLLEELRVCNNIIFVVWTRERNILVGNFLVRFNKSVFSRQNDPPWLHSGSAFKIHEAIYRLLEHAAFIGGSSTQNPCAKIHHTLTISIQKHSPRLRNLGVRSNFNRRRRQTRCCF